MAYQVKQKLEKKKKTARNIHSMAFLAGFISSLEQSVSLVIFYAVSPFSESFNFPVFKRTHFSPLNFRGSEWPVSRNRDRDHVLFSCDRQKKSLPSAVYMRIKGVGGWPDL